MSGKRDKEGKKEGKRGWKKTAKQEEQEKKPEGTRQTRVTWLGLGEEWGVVRDVRKMIYGMLTPLERVTVEKAHGVNRAFERHKKHVCEWAVGGGCLEVVKWARENGCPWSQNTCMMAAYGGHLEVLQWARANGCPWDASTCTAAASEGHLEMLQWARGSGCPWDDWTCSYAASGGYLEVLKWAHANGCPWDKKNVRVGSRKRTFRGFAVGSGKWLSME